MRLKSKSISGYTLIELAIVLIALGLMIGIGAGIYNIYQKQKSIKDTQLNIRVVANAIADFKSKNGRYPCAAPLNVPRTNANYGRQICDPVTAGAFNARGVFGQNRQIPVPTGLTDGVMVGAVPFRQLNLREDDVVDGYGARLLYAVTASQAVAGEYSLQGGAIEIKDSSAALKSALNPANSADLVILSFGPDNAGAVMKNGANSSTPCTDVGVLQSKNCAFGDQAIYQSGFKSTSGTVDQMDDTITFFARGEQEPWDAGAGTEIYNKNNSVGQVGIMVADPGTTDVDIDSTLKADVVGNVRIRNSLYAEKVADFGDDSTFTEAKVIGGDLVAGTGGLKCADADKYISGITNNQPDCGYAAVTCPKELPVIGITASGDLQCQDDTCPAGTVDMCGETKNLPAAKQGKTVKFKAGDSLKTTFQCKHGLWVSVKSTGVCHCKPDTKTETVPCGPGYTGTRKVKTTRICPDGTDFDEVQLSNSCQCVGGSQNRTIDCPPGQTGQITEKRTLKCTGPGAGTWGGWIEQSRNCKACAVQIRQREIACPDGKEGTIIQKMTRDCNTGTWGNWIEDSNSCKCGPTKTQTRTIACPEGQTGEINQSRTSVCGAGWGDWTPTSSNCTNTGARCRWNPLVDGQRQSFRTTNLMGSRCDCDAGQQPCHLPIGGGDYTVFSRCSCD